MDFITQLLAQLFNSFKAKNPRVAAIILFLLGLIVYFADQGSFLGIFTLPVWAAEPLKWVVTLLGFLTGSRTYSFLNPTGTATK